MNQNFKNAPGISQLYKIKLIQSAHLKKLQNIKQNRKAQLSIDKNRTDMITSILRHKAHSFAANFNTQHDQINKSNLHIVKKLGLIKPSASQHRRRTDEQTALNISGRSRLSLKQHSKQREKQKQNLRLYVKLRAVSSNLKTQAFLVQHQQTQKIKNRLMRYSRDLNNSNKVGLKSERYINTRGNYLDGNSLALKRSNTGNQAQPKPKSTAQYYKKQDIINNTIIKLQKRYNATHNPLHKQNVSQNTQQTFLTAAQTQYKQKTKPNKYTISYAKNQIRNRKDTAVGARNNAGIKLQLKSKNEWPGQVGPMSKPRQNRTQYQKKITSIIP